MDQSSNGTLRRAIQSLSRRICDTNNIRLEHIVQKVEPLCSLDDSFPEAYGLIEIIRLTNVDATTVVSYILAEDFSPQPTISIFPTDQANYLIEKVIMFYVFNTSTFHKISLF